MLKIVVYAAVFVVSALLTYGFVRLGFRLKLVDVPNHRSSHSQPKPRGGGAAFTLAFFIGLFSFWALGLLETRWVMPLVIGGIPVALIGFLDDLRSRSALVRLAIHFLAAAGTFAYLTNTFSTDVNISFLPGTGGDVLSILFAIFYVAWMINLYNFMDGIDGLASLQAIVVSALSAGICAWQQNWTLFSLYVLLVSTVTGFLLFNWSPAKIFMGDCGAYFLGFAFAALALMSKIYSGQSLMAHMILMGVFITDATYTLMLRAIQRKRLYQAHRDHGFQHFVSKGRSHGQVALILNGITLFWLAPLAALSVLYTDWASTILVISYVPLLILMVRLQAGIELNAPGSDGLSASYKST